MKKLIFLCLMMLLCLPLAAYGAGVGGPSTNGQFKLSIGLDNDYVFNRDMKLKSISVPVEENGNGNGNGTPGCEIKNMYRTMLNVGFGIFDFLDVYVKLGAADYKFKSDLYDPLTGTYEGELKANTKWGFAYGAGLKGAYTFNNGPVKGLIIGGDVQYLRHKQKYRDKFTDAVTSEVFPSKGKVTLQEWQVGPFVGYKIMNFIPYVGVKYSDVRLKFKAEDVAYKSKFKADDHFGVFVGLTYEVIPQLKLNLEGRFIDETGFNFNVIFKF